MQSISYDDSSTIDHYSYRECGTRNQNYLVQYVKVS